MADRSSRPHGSPNQLSRRDRAADHRPAGHRAAGPGPDRLAAGPEPLDRAPGPEPLRLPAAWRTWTAPPRSRSAAMSGTGPASWSTSTSRNSATSPTAAATAPPAGRRARSNRAATPGAGRSRHGNAGPGLQLPAHRPGRPLPAGLHRDPARRAQGNRRRVPAPARTPGTPATASPSSASSATTAPATARDCGPLPAPHLGITRKRTRPYRPQTNGKVERFHRTLADEWAYAQPYPPKPSAATPCQTGSTSTTITADTPRSAATRPPAASPTCQGRTASQRAGPGPRRLEMAMRRATPRRRKPRRDIPR